MSEKDVGLCRCACHESLAEIIHVVPCCKACPHCHQRIAGGMQPEHVKQCAADQAARLSGR